MKQAVNINFIRKTYSSSVSNTYELINHILTFGFDILWRKKIARLAAKKGGRKWADMCTGTGETAAYLSRLADANTKIYACDASENMLDQAKLKPEAHKISFHITDVKQLDFPDNYFDVITISFATRNINSNRETLIQTFKEFYRVLKPDGIFINLETSQPSLSILKKIFHFYIKSIVKLLGGSISGSYSAYAYLAHTIPRFYNASELKIIIEEAGFNNTSYRKLLFGIAAIHQSYKTKIK